MSGAILSPEEQRSVDLAPPTDTERLRIPTWVLLAFAAAALGLHLATLVRYPPPFIDEANLASQVWGLIHTGRAFGPIQDGVLQNFDGYWTYFPWLGVWFQSLGPRFLGLSFFSMRLASLAFGAILLGAVYSIGSSLRGRPLGAFAAALVSLSGSFLYSAHLARHDVIIAAAGYGAVALYLSDRGSSWSVKSVLSGLTIGVAFESHPNAMIFGPAILGLYLLDHGMRAVRLRRFWCFVAGGTAGVAFWASMHVLPYPKTFIAITRLAFADTKNPPILEPSLWAHSALTTVLLIVRANDVKTVLLVGAIVIVARRGSPSERKLLALFGTLALGFFALVPYKPVYYEILVGPACDLLVASVFLDPKGWALAGRGVRALPGIALVCLSFAGNASQLTGNPLGPYNHAVDSVRTITSPDGVIMGDPTLWMGLTDRRFVMWQELTYYRRFVPGTSLEDGFRAYRPDYFIEDDNVRWSISDDTSRYEPWSQLIYLPKSDLRRFLASHGRLIARIDGGTTLGEVDVYQLDWGPPTDQLPAARVTR